MKNYQPRNAIDVGREIEALQLLVPTTGTPGFCEFQLWIDDELSQLERKWAALAAPTAARGFGARQPNTSPGSSHA